MRTRDQHKGVTSMAIQCLGGVRCCRVGCAGVLGRYKRVRLFWLCLVPEVHGIRCAFRLRARECAHARTLWCGAKSRVRVAPPSRLPPAHCLHRPKWTFAIQKVSNHMQARVCTKKVTPMVSLQRAKERCQTNFIVFFTGAVVSPKCRRTSDKTTWATSVVVRGDCVHPRNTRAHTQSPVSWRLPHGAARGFLIFSSFPQNQSIDRLGCVAFV